MKTYRIVSLCLMLSFLFSQQSIRAINNIKLTEKPLENIIINTDRDMYLSGENIWFKAYCFNNNKTLGSMLSKVLYIELYDAQKETSIKKKLQIINGVAQSAIEMPDNLSSGNYIIRAYTNYLRNYPPEYYAYKVVTVINPNEQITQESELITNDPVVGIPESNGLEISTNKETYSSRELVNVEINKTHITNQELVNLSVSVVKKGTILPQNQNSIHPEESNDLTKSFLKWVPETRDISISGQVFYKNNGKAAPNIPIYVSVFKNYPMLYINESREDGTFNVTINNLTSIQDIYLSAKNNGDQELGVSVNNDFSQKYADFQTGSISFDTTCQSVIKQMFTNRQTQNLFNSNIQKNARQIPPFPFCFNNPQYTYITRDYVSTPTLEIFLREIISRINVSKRMGKYSLSIYDPDLNIFFNDPLILVDNIPVFDINEVMKIPYTSIEKIEVYDASFILGDYTVNGIISFTTNTENFGGVKIPEGSIFFEYQTLSPAVSFTAPIYNTKEKWESKIPDFRNLLYWNPQLEISKEGAVNFYTSDHYSEYEIIVKGYSTDGTFYYGKKSITVK